MIPQTVAPMATAAAMATTIRAGDGHNLRVEEIEFLYQLNLAKWFSELPPNQRRPIQTTGTEPGPTGAGFVVSLAVNAEWPKEDQPIFPQEVMAALAHGTEVRFSHVSVVSSAWEDGDAVWSLRFIIKPTRVASGKQ